MDKDFKGWHSKKEKIENQNETISFRERDIWWCHLGLNLGHEQDGKVRSAMISQLRLFSAKRITDKLSFAEKDSFEEIKKAIKQLF